MSISSQGGKKPRPSGVGTGKKAVAGGKRPRKPIKINQGRNWGPIGLTSAVVVVLLAIIGYAVFAASGAKGWQDQAAEISGIVNFRETAPALVEQNNHQSGPIRYDQIPPVAGPHNPTWQNCMGDVYDAPIVTEHVVHSMEHGAVWVTYRTGLPADQVEDLASKVRGNPYTLLSPIDNLDKPISLQAWGYQLKVDNAGDERIDAFIRALRQNATLEPGAACSSGITATGTGSGLGQQMQGS